MVLRIEPCEKCGGNVFVMMPALFPNLSSEALMEYKELLEAKPSSFCKKCLMKQEEKQ